MRKPAQILADNPHLIPYRVTLTEEPGDSFTLVFDCYAEDDDHAAEQAQHAYPMAQIHNVTFFPKSTKPRTKTMKPETMTAFANAILAAPAIKPTGNQLAAKADRLGFLRAQLDQIASEAQEIRDELEAAALPVIEGTFYRVSFSTHAGASRTDWQAIARKLGASPQIIRANTKKGAESVHMKITAKIVKH